MKTSGSLKVAINVQILPGASGGVATFTSSLIHALGRLYDGQETYLLVVGSQQQLEWLKPHAGPNQQFVLKPSVWKNPHTTANGNDRLSLPGLVKRFLGPLLPTARHLQRLVNIAPQWPEVPLSDGFYESLECDVLHFPTQGFVLCALPIIYNPHDLQHLHYPQFFSLEELMWRETIYPAGCNFANTVIVGSQWIKEDLIRQYRINSEKIQVIPEGPPTQIYPKVPEEEVAKVKAKYQLEQPFLLYPAATWPHKNHLRLLESLAHLRNASGLNLRLVCTGHEVKSFWPRITASVDELGLQSQVKFLGFVEEKELRVILRLSQGLIMPSLFEACSLPVFEAWSEGVPVACSSATALPDQVLDAAIMFDPYSIESMAEAIAKIVTDPKTQKNLRSNGFRRSEDFDWQRTAKAYRAVYRRAAGYPLTEEDRWLLSWDWMKEPRKEMENRL